MYVCGFLLKKLLTWHNCTVCRDILSDSSNTCDDVKKLFLSFKAYEDKSRVFHSLHVPSERFDYFIRQCNGVFSKLFELNKTCKVSEIRETMVGTIMKTVQLLNHCDELDMPVVERYLVEYHQVYEASHNFGIVKFIAMIQ